ncbi:MAG TPA: glucose-1-phosphate adenylyltransferase [Desulfobacteraceae bacterium]|nr:glucose-1-phosphate adenylyltransferase [Desulfobacteraceae bacterium]
MFKPSVLAMILAGGRVDELGVLTFYRPKSAVPFGGFARVVDFALSNLMWSGIELVAILSQYRSFSLINHIGTGAAWDMIGRYRGVSILPPFKGLESSDWYKGSADAVYQNLDFVRYHAPAQILILSGDHVYQMDYREMIRYHREKEADLTAAFIEVDPAQAHRFGVGEIDFEDDRFGRLTRYEEKPTRPRGNLASLTILCFRREVLYEMLEENQKQQSFEFGRDIIPMMMERKLRVYGYKYSGYWGYTRTVGEYWKTSMDLLGRDPKIDMEKWGLRTNLDHRDIRDCQPLKIGSCALLDNSMAYNGCHVDGTVRNSILFPGVRIEEGAEVSDSVLFFNNTVRSGTQITRTVSDVNTTFGPGCRIGGPMIDGEREGITVIGWNNLVPEGTVVGRNCTIYPRLAAEKWPAEAIADGEVLR